jgi:hypothetical protein
MMGVQKEKRKKPRIFLGDEGIKQKESNVPVGFVCDDNYE